MFINLFLRKIKININHCNAWMMDASHIVWVMTTRQLQIRNHPYALTTQ